MDRKEWLKWRQEGIGASDMPVIMGVSAYKTRYQLWEVKAGLRSAEEDDEETYITRKGNRLEPKTRAFVELHFGVNFPPALFEAAERPLFRTSLDGWDAETGSILETKFNGKEKHQQAINNVVPHDHMWQCQHQLYVVPGSERVYYVSHNPEMPQELQHAAVVVHRIPEMQAQLEEEGLKFWQLVLDKTPPELSHKDTKEVRDPIITNWAIAYAEAHRTAEKWKNRCEEIKAVLLKNDKISSHARVSVGPLNINVSYRTGNVDYAKIPELKGVDLSKYRKTGSKVTTIRIEEADNAKEGKKSS